MYRLLSAKASSRRMKESRKRQISEPHRIHSEAYGLLWTSITTTCAVRAGCEPGYRKTIQQNWAPVLLSTYVTYEDFCKANTHYDIQPFSFHYSKRKRPLKRFIHFLRHSPWGSHLSITPWSKCPPLSHSNTLVLISNALESHFPSHFTSRTLKSCITF